LSHVFIVVSTDFVVCSMNKEGVIRLEDQQIKRSKWWKKPNCLSQCYYYPL